MSESFGAIAAVIVAYNSEDTLRENIAAIVPQVAHVVIVDNASDAPTQAILDSIEKEFNQSVKILRNSSNTGLGSAQNKGINHAVKNYNPDWILLLDDDSRAAPDMIANMATTYASAACPEQVGIIGPDVTDIQCDMPYRILQVPGNWSFKRILLKGKTVEDNVYFLIASGSLIRRAMLEETGLMREDFFIDFIDCEFCLRAITHGWTILAAGNATIFHALGNKRQHDIGNRTFYSTNYPAERRLIAARNRMIFWRLYTGKVPPAFTFHNICTFVKDAMLVLVFEQHRFRKFLQLCRGLITGACARNINKPPPRLA